MEAWAVSGVPPVGWGVSESAVGLFSRCASNCVLLSVLVGCCPCVGKKLQAATGKFIVIRRRCRTLACSRGVDDALATQQATVAEKKKSRLRGDSQNGTASLELIRECNSGIAG